MGIDTVERPPKNHTSSEFQNLWTCQKLIKLWVDHPEWNSYDVLPILFRALHTGEASMQKSVGTLNLAQVVRSSDSHISGFPGDLLPDPQRAYLLLSRYSDDLDTMLRDKPKTMEGAISDAAKAYYVFERIHPFPDGNGRIGRMIAKTVLKAGGLKDPVFHDPRWYGGERSTHLQAMERVGNTNNLAHLELEIAQSLVGSYVSFGRDFLKSRELERIIEAKQAQSRQVVPGTLLRDIWSGFGDLPLYGNKPKNKVV